MKFIYYSLSDVLFFVIFALFEFLECFPVFVGDLINVLGIGF